MEMEHENLPQEEEEEEPEYVQYLRRYLRSQGKKWPGRPDEKRLAYFREAVRKMQEHNALLKQLEEEKKQNEKKQNEE